MARGLGHSANEYYDAVKKLLPKGPAWELEDDSYFMRMLYLAALEFARVDKDIITLLDEDDPRSAQITLDEWFYQWGIPDECLKLLADPTTEQYRQVLITKITTLGYTFPELVQIIAAALGFEVSLSAHETHTVNSDVNAELYGDQWAYYAIVVTAEETPVTYFLANSTVDMALSTWGNELFECLIKSLAPAHVGVVFQYGSEE